jgi:predicted Zn-dependent peptidase
LETYSHATLPNGVRILTAQMPYVRSVSLAYYFNVGSRYEGEEQSGISHFIEHMFFKGSEHYPTAQSISETIDGVGGVLDAETGKELTVYSARVASRHFELAMGLIADMVRHPRFEPAEVEKEQRVILEELSMYMDTPQDWVGVLADEVVWPGLPLGREVAGTRETIQAMTREAVAAYYRSHYVPGSLVLSVAGDVSHERVVEVATALLGDWRPADVPRWQPSPAPLDVPRVLLQRRETEQTNLCLMTRGLANKDPEHYTLVLLSAILGDSMSSRLFYEVRERQGLAYDVSSSPSSYHDTGALVVYAGVDPERTQAALRAILAELARMRDEPVSEAELTRAKEYTKGRMALRLEDSGSIASWLGGHEILLGEIPTLDEVMARLDAVTAEDIQHMAHELFREEWLRLALIGPHDDAAEFDRLLRL